MESSEATRESLILDNLRLVHHVVKKIIKAPSTSYIYQELYSEGIVGLTEAAQKYEPGKAKFSTYAYIRIRGAILNYLQANKSIIKTPWTRDKNIQLNFLSLSQSKDGSESHELDIYDEEVGYNLTDLLESIKVQLSEQEYRVLMLKYHGYTQLEISEKLCISTAKVNRIIAFIRKITSSILKK